MVKLLIADDHQLFIDGLTSLLKNEEGISIEGQALNGQEVMQQLAVKIFDIILLDINMPDTDIVKLTKNIKEQFPHIKIVVLTMYHGTRYYTKLIKYGISGYLFKSASKQDFLQAIEKASKGEMYIHKDLFVEGHNHKIDLMPTNDIHLTNPEQILTKREIEVLKLVLQEYSNNAIAEKLCISTGTVDTHRKNIILKLGVKNTVGLIKYCVQNNFV